MARGLSWPFRRTTAADYAFAKHFDLPIIPVVEGGDLSVASYDAKAGRMINSDFLTGMDVKEAIPAMIAEVERRGFGSRRVNYRLRDAIFSRQRYWGEPFPIYYKDDIARPLAEDCLPLELPPIENFGPTAEGEPPLARRRGMADARRVSVRAEHDARFRRIVGLLLALHGPA